MMQEIYIALAAGVLGAGGFGILSWAILWLCDVIAYRRAKREWQSRGK